MADETTNDESPVDALIDPAQDAPDYTFDGYEVEFSDLVVLTPPSAAQLPRTRSES